MVAELCAVTEAGMTLSPFSKCYLEKLPLQATLRSEESLISFRLRTPGGGGALEKGGGGRHRGHQPSFPAGPEALSAQSLYFPHGQLSCEFTWSLS